MTSSALHALKSAYYILENITPLENFNCGEICSARCCKGSENDGMFLFPYEDELLRGADFRIAGTEANFGCKALVCGGECSRNLRPLACRFFPLFPVITEENGHEKIKACIDPRASICPLTDENAVISRKFARAVRKAGIYLSMDDEIKEYMKKISAEILDIYDLEARLYG